MQKSMFTKIALLSILCTSTTIPSMRDDADRKARFEQSKNKVLWQMGSMALGAVAFGGFAYLVTNSLDGERSSDASASYNYNKKFKAVALIGSACTGAIIGGVAVKDGEQKKRTLYKLGGIATGAALLTGAAYLATKNMPGNLKSEGYGEYGCDYWLACPTTPFKAATVIGATGAGMAIGAYVSGSKDTPKKDDKK